MFWSPLNSVSQCSGRRSTRSLNVLVAAQLGLSMFWSPLNSVSQCSGRRSTRSLNVLVAAQLGLSMFWSPLNSVSQCSSHRSTRSLNVLVAAKLGLSMFWSPLNSVSQCSGRRSTGSLNVLVAAQLGLSMFWSPLNSVSQCSGRRSTGSLNVLVAAQLGLSMFWSPLNSVSQCSGRRSTGSLNVLVTAQLGLSMFWSPLNWIHILLTQFTGETNKTLDLIVIRMASCNQILDPWLYVIFRKNSMLRIIRRIKACFVKKKEPPRNGTIRGPSVRYVIGNKSFTIEATTVGKTVMPGQGGGGNQSPLYNFQDLNDLSDYSEESMYRLMCVSSNSLDNSHRRRSDQRPLINLRLGHSPTEKRKHEATPPSTPPSSPDKLVSLPFIERPKVKHVAEISECTLLGSYESAGSTHYTPYVRSNMKPGTPTNDLTEQQDSSSTADNKSCESQRHPPKSLIITDSNYVLISAPLPTPERERTPLLLKPNNQTLHVQPVVTPVDMPLPPPHQNSQLPGDTGGVTGALGMVQQKNGVISRRPFVHQTNDPFQVQTNLHTQFPCNKTNNHFDYCTRQTTCQVESDKDVTLLQPHSAQTSPITNGLDESRPTLTICHRHLNGFTNSFTQDASLHRSPAKDLILIEPCQAMLYNVNDVGDILLCSEYTNISNKCSDSEMSLFNGQKHSLENDGKFKSWNSFH
ncbi:hypothetical protein Btru_065404 [Bulinus truncatus]|nr:hypothetical protein Btru_065404 [Bulinus truncatus]